MKVNFDEKKCNETADMRKCHSVAKMLHKFPAKMANNSQEQRQYPVINHTQFRRAKINTLTVNSIKIIE